ERRIRFAAYCIDDRLDELLEAALQNPRVADIVDAEDARRDLRGDAVNRIVQHRYPRVQDLFDIDALAQRATVILEEIVLDHRAALAWCSLAECLADRAVHLRQRRSAVPRFELHAVVLRR